ncbi:LysR family transcriptional regulator [Actinoallomurus purpureus]|uniref:LysR family transcriptional regulator n=1 Tax=Actinoallomurus purpureus TaxID=478114 RepID=UPI002092A3FA|nr:LysR family transcriptional regulator [Actinoallomurus purpureus]MCO6011035.1 LysR family transcriptional regulator [Actinoallomurus purpureus]
MDTRLLRSFLAVVRAGGITAAAAELGFVQSTITTHVQALERLTGTPLLDRHPGGVSPTHAGALLTERAQQILDLEDRMLAELATDAARPAGPVRLCAPESVCAYQLAPLLPALRERFPEVRLSLFPADTRTALTAIADRRADLALCLEPSVHTPQADLIELGVQELSLIAPPTTGLPRDRPITPEELAATGVLLLEEGCAYSDELAALIAAGGSPVAQPRFGGVETVKRCVAAGLGLALLPTATVADELADGRLVRLRPPGLARQRLWLLRPRSRWASPAVQAVHTLLTETVPIRSAP